MHILDERISDAAATGDIETLREVFASGALRPDMTYMGLPLLCSAAWSGEHETVKFLLQAGAKVNQQDKDGTTALMYAAQTNDDISAGYLMDFGANESLKDRFKKSADDYARKPKHFSVINVIEKKVAARNACTMNLLTSPRAREWNYPKPPQV